MTLPAPTPATATSRYFVAGTRQYVFVSTISNKSAPTLAEVNAGTEVTGDVLSVSGFNEKSASFAVPDAGTRRVSTVPGRITSDDSSITFHASLDAQDVRGIFTRDQDGFMLIFPEGIIASGVMDVFPVRVSSVSKNQDIEVDGQIMVDFDITSSPVPDVDIPTA